MIPTVVHVEVVGTLPGGQACMVLEKPGEIEIRLLSSEITKQAALSLEQKIQHQFDTGSIAQRQPASDADEPPELLDRV